MMNNRPDKILEDEQQAWQESRRWTTDLTLCIMHKTLDHFPFFSSAHFFRRSYQVHFEAI